MIEFCLGFIIGVLFGGIIISFLSVRKDDKDE
jgi:hypothetical protein